MMMTGSDQLPSGFLVLFAISTCVATSLLFCHFSSVDDVPSICTAVKFDGALGTYRGVFVTATLPAGCAALSAATAMIVVMEAMVTTARVFFISKSTPFSPETPLRE